MPQDSYFGRGDRLIPVFSRFPIMYFSLISHKFDFSQIFEPFAKACSGDLDAIISPVLTLLCWLFLLLSGDPES
jgi:hypothetical protein